MKKLIHDPTPTVSRTLAYQKLKQSKSSIELFERSTFIFYRLSLFRHYNVSIFTCNIVTQVQLHGSERADLSAMAQRGGKEQFRQSVLDSVSFSHVSTRFRPCFLIKSTFSRLLSTCKDKEQMLFSTQVEFDPSGDEKIGKRVSLEAVYQVWLLLVHS